MNKKHLPRRVAKRLLWGETINKKCFGSKPTFFLFALAFAFLLPKAVMAAPSGSVLEFDGNDYLTVSDVGVLDQAQGLSWSVWVYPASTPGSDAYIFYRDTAYYLKQTSSNTMVGAVYYSSSWHTATTSALTTGQWTHIELTYDTTAGYLKIYKNGVEADSQSNSTAITAVATAMYIGAKNTTPDNPFSGKIDDLRLYQYARTPAQVKQDYNQGMAFYAGPQTTCAEDPGSCVTKGLVGYWSFEEGSGQTTADLSGNGNTGTLGANSSPGTDDPKWTTAGSLPRDAVIGGRGALSFDGSNDYVVKSNPVAGFDTISTQFSASAWLMRQGENVPASNYEEVIDTRSSGWATYFILKTDDTLDVGYIRTMFKTSAGSKNTNSSSINDNQWYHVVVTFDGNLGSNNIKIYIDGVLTTQDDLTGDLSDLSTAPFYIGGWPSPAGIFNGLIDDVRIYNRALSPEEIRYLYNRGGPVSRWSFDEGSGSTAYDSTSNSNDLTLTNMEAGDWQTGKSGSGLSFDGTNEYLTRAYDTDFDFSTNNFTLGGWFKHDTISTNPDYLITRFTGAGWKTYMDSDGDLCFGIDDDATFTPDDSACSVNQNYDDNQWHYFSAVRNTSSIGLYIDGVKQAEDTSLSATAALSGTSPVLRVGIDSDGSSNAWQGMLDEIVIYGYARTQAQILQDYNSGKSIHFK